MTRLSRNNSGHVPVRDLLRQPFGNRRLAHASFADQHRIIFRPPAKHLDDALDFVPPADHRIEFAFLGQFGQVATKRAQGRRLDIFLIAGSPPPSCFRIQAV